MPNILLTQYHDFANDGDIATLDLQSGFNAMLIYGASAGATTVTTSGTVANDMDVVIYWNGDPTASAATVLGTAMPTGLITLSHFIVAHYNAVSTSWNVRFLPNAATAYLTNAMVSATAAIARTKLANGTASYVLVNSGAGVMSEEQFLNQVRGGFGADVSGFSGVLKAVAGVFSAASIVNADISAVAAIAVSKLAGGSAAQVLISDSLGVPTWTTLSGDLTISDTGVATTAASSLKFFSITIPTADVLTLNATPVTLVGAQGAGLGICVVNAWASMSYNSVAYATNGTMYIKCQTSVKEQGFWTSGRFLFGTVTRTVPVNLDVVVGIGATDTCIIANDPLVATIATGNPTAGNSDITIFGYYTVVSVP